jgi:uncharacterized protein (TIGR00725 family)
MTTESGRDGMSDSPGGAVRRDPVTGVQIRIGVMGSANAPADVGVAAVCRRLGRAIAERGACLLTGACPGLPHESVLGAKEAGGHVVGVSPAATLRDHAGAFGSPYREYDVLIFTGLGVMGRELVNIRSSDIVVVIGGRSGTLGEFAIAYEEGKLIGVLTGTGGITGALSALERSLDKDTGAEVIHDGDPVRLIDRLLARYESTDYTCPCWPQGGGRDHAADATERARDDVPADDIRVRDRHDGVREAREHGSRPQA